MRVDYVTPRRGVGAVVELAAAAGPAGAAADLAFAACSASLRFSSCACFFQSVSICSECSSAMKQLSAEGLDLQEFEPRTTRIHTDTTRNDFYIYPCLSASSVV